MRYYFREAKELCGLGHDFEIRNEEDYNFAIRVWKEKTIEARRAGNDELAARLSEARQVFKRRYTRLVSLYCPACGSAKSRYAHRCQICARVNRSYHNRIMQNSIITKEHEIETAIIIPPRFQPTGVLSSILRKLATTGHVGESFVTSKQPTSVSNIARSLGLEVTIRIANLDERDRKKRRWRVWRTDGLDMDKVNEIISKRLAGGPVPESKPCVPPDPATLPPKHRKVGGRVGRPPTVHTGEQA